MNITEKFSALTKEQHELFNAVRDGQGLETFLSKTAIELTPEEKNAALEFIASGLLPLDDDELDAVAGGCSGSEATYGNCPKCNGVGTYKIEGNYLSATCSACGYVSAAG